MAMAGSTPLRVLEHVRRPRPGRQRRGGRVKSRSSQAQCGVYRTWVRENSRWEGNGIIEKKGPHMTVTANPQRRGWLDQRHLAQLVPQRTQRAPEAAAAG